MYMPMTNKMPKVNFDLIPTEVKNDPRFNLIVKKDGSIRATKPKVDKNNHVTGKAAYGWRMIVFCVSPKRQHQCMPCTADFDLPAYDENGKWKYELTRAMVEESKSFEDAIINSIDKSQWHGIRTWGSVFYGR